MSRDKVRARRLELLQDIVFGLFLWFCVAVSIVYAWEVMFK